MGSASKMAAALLAMSFNAASLRAQKEIDIPARPHLEQDVDSNRLTASVAPTQPRQ